MAAILASHGSCTIIRVVLTSLFFAVLAFSANQGSAVEVKIPNEPGLKSVEVSWQGRKVPAFRVDHAWITILGVDLDAKPGEHEATAVLSSDNGVRQTRDITVKVQAKQFPVSQLNVDEKFVDLSKADLSRVSRESKETNAIYGRVTSDIVPDEPFSVPIPGETGTNFGSRRVFNGQPRAPHSGADLHAATGTPVHATNRGRVVLAKNLFFTGNTVILDHGLGIYSIYAHLSRIEVKAGEVVKNGQTVGLSGATGRVTAPHLHWAMRVQGARVDPFSLVH